MYGAALSRALPLLNEDVLATLKEENIIHYIHVTLTIRQILIVVQLIMFLSCLRFSYTKSIR